MFKIHLNWFRTHWGGRGRNVLLDLVPIGPYWPLLAPIAKFIWIVPIINCFGGTCKVRRLNNILLQIKRLNKILSQLIWVHRHTTWGEMRMRICLKIYEKQKDRWGYNTVNKGAMMAKRIGFCQHTTQNDQQWAILSKICLILAVFSDQTGALRLTQLTKCSRDLHNLKKSQSTRRLVD